MENIYKGALAIAAEELATRTHEGDDAEWTFWAEGRAFLDLARYIQERRDRRDGSKRSPHRVQFGLATRTKQGTRLAWHSDR